MKQQLLDALTQVETALSALKDLIVALPEDGDLQKKIDELTAQVAALAAQVAEKDALLKQVDGLAKQIDSSIPD